MEVLHVTQTRNVKRIYSSKLYRNKPILPIYNTVMENYYGMTYDKSKGLVFAFPEAIYNRNKIIKDFIYWKVWGNQRNLLLAKYSYDEYYENLNNGIKVFSHLTVKEDSFSVLLLDIEYEKLFSMHRHVQNADMGPYWVDMDIRYEHDDKPLVLLNYDIEPIKIKRIVGTAKVNIKRKNKVDVSLRI